MALQPSCLSKPPNPSLRPNSTFPTAQPSPWQHLRGPSLPDAAGSTQACSSQASGNRAGDSDILRDRPVAPINPGWETGLLQWDYPDSEASPTSHPHRPALPPFKRKLFFIFNWRIFALQRCVVFCHTWTWISRKYTRVSSPLEHPSYLPPQPAALGFHRAPCVVQQIPTGLWLTRGILYVSALSFRPTLSFPASASLFPLSVSPLPPRQKNGADEPPSLWND